MERCMGRPTPCVLITILFSSSLSSMMVWMGQAGDLRVTMHRLGSQERFQECNPAAAEQHDSTMHMISCIMAAPWAMVHSALSSCGPLCYASLIPFPTPSATPSLSWISPCYRDLNPQPCYRPSWPTADAAEHQLQKPEAAGGD